MRRLGSMLRWCGQLVAWLVVLGLAAVVTVSVLVPRLAGATPYAVLTGSMRPTMPPGTMVVVRPVAAGDVRVGDVITYQLRSGEPDVVTHRVVTVGIDGTGHRIFRTRGDANDVVDAAWVTPVQLKGVRWYDVPYLGRFTNLLSGAQRQLVLAVTVGFLLVYAVLMFSGELRDRRRRAVSRPAVTAAPAERPRVAAPIHLAGSAGRRTVLGRQGVRNG